MPMFAPIIAGESTMSFTRTEALAAIGSEAYGGDDYDPSGWSAFQIAQANSALLSALRLFYGSHDWQFLRPWITAVFEPGIDTYDMPADFGGMVGAILYTGRWSAQSPIVQADMNTVEAELALPTGRGYPNKFALEYLPLSGESQGQRQAIKFNRSPISACTLRAQYYVHPYDLSSTRTYPLGGPAHAECLKWACKAMAELEIKKIANGGCMGHFNRLLADSVRVDRRNSPTHLGNTGMKRLVPSSAEAPLFTGQVSYNGNPIN